MNGGPVAKKSVLLIAESINLNGGVTRTLLELLKHIDPEQYEVTVYVMRPKDSDLSAVPAHVTVLTNDFDLPYLGAWGVVRRLFQQGKFLGVLAYLATLVAWRARRNRARYVRFFIRRHPMIPRRFDIAAAYAMLDTYSNQYAAERVNADRRIMWFHTTTDLYADQSLEGLEGVFSRFDAINCVGLGVEQSMVRRFPTLEPQLRVRYNLLDEEAITRLASEQVPLALPDAAVRLATVGRISHEKGTDLLLAAAATLRDEGYDFVWTVVGPDHNAVFAAQVKARWQASDLEKVVQFVGAQRNPYPFIAACDIYVQPSRVEGYCTTTVEAKVLGKAVIRTDTSDAPEQFQHGVNGSIVPAALDGLANEIKRLIDDPGLRHSYEQALRAEASFAVPDIAWFFE